ncbi:MAG: hypothetical protein IRY91_04305 [Gemmatimonadaceae bacterium]|nr:hypothetical protein [Gemmatimonadaceae bacterium]
MIRAYDKKHIALEQLETALRIFKEGRDYFSVITLDGAADEILGCLARSKDWKSAVDSLVETAASLSQYMHDEGGDARWFRDRANRARNALKHLNANEGPTIALDPVEEAIDMLNRAIDNYWELEHALTENMAQFCRSQRPA